MAIAPDRALRCGLRCVPSPEMFGGRQTTSLGPAKSPTLCRLFMIAAIGCGERFVSGSFAFVSLLVPATAVLLGLGGLIAAAQFSFWPIWLAAVLGAIAGDWLAYWLAFVFKDRVLKMWPLGRHPELVARSVVFFNKWGMLAVFVGRFFGPFRAVVPLIAGLNAMPWLNFQIANVASAALWAAGILLPGFVGVRWLMD
jgi:membrane protein DedA with SNARE-associated domain